jgi:hypothetical protein
MMHSNGDLGIDLAPAGVTPDDAGDADSGANDLQNFPVLAAATASGSQTRIDGTLNSTPNRTFTLDFYASAACDPSGYGEGQVYLGGAVVTTDAAGDAPFSVTLPAATTADQVVTATATDADGSTSEFSACVTVVGGAMPGDLNGDGRVDLDDLILLLTNYGCEAACAGDADGDGDCDLDDLILVLSNYGS